MGLIIKNYCLFCNQGSSEYNEDVVGITPSGAWVLDGATGLNGRNLVSENSDARWYVQWWNEFLYKNISNSTTLKRIIEKGIEEINIEYKKRLSGVTVDKLDLPSSSIAIVKFHEDKIEYLMLGDCSLFMRNDENRIIKDNTVCEFDNLVFDKMIDIVKTSNKPFKEVRDRVQDIIISNRLKKNTEGGYWILDFDKDAIPNSLHGYLDIKENSSFMLASDGFTCACERYSIFREEEILEIAEKYGIEHIYSLIRKFEEEDSNAMKIPRFKIKDDSSCVYFNLDRE
jgi:serine/threonine protein phosphatase PrpC